MKNHEIKWTEKIQAIASIIAILGGIAAFYELFSTDSDMQKQINSLTTLSEQSIEQTNLLKEELDILRDRNSILIEQLHIDKDQWEKQNRPDFILDLGKWDSWVGADDTSQISGFEIINNGGAAHLVDFRYNKGNNCKLKIPKTFIPNQGRVKFNISIPKLSNIYLDFSIKFRDIEGNSYIQRFYSDNVEFFEIQNRNDSGLEIFNIVTEKPFKEE